MATVMNKFTTAAIFKALNLMIAIENYMMTFFVTLLP